MKDVIDAFKANPMLLAMMVMLSSVIGTGGASMYSTFAFATEQYVNDKIYHVDNKSEHRFLTLKKSNIEREIFQLEILEGQSPDAFSNMHARRLSELRSQHADLVRQIDHLEQRIRDGGR